jgi:hypothetical protein
MMSRVAFLGVIRALQSDINICYLYPPACIYPIITEDLPVGAAAGVYF